MEETSWKKYYELEPIRRLRNEGRELIGKTITLTEKRDGENVSIWLNPKCETKVSSHNIAEASEDILNRFKATAEYSKAIDLLNSELKGYHKEYVLYGELIAERGPTRIEPKHKKLQWVLFDAWDVNEKRYLSYTQLYQLAYHYKIPVVKVVGFFIPTCYEDLAVKTSELMKWCRRHRREGIVGKDYESQVFFKEKIDLPKLPKLPKQPTIQLPPMPTEKIIRALQHAYDEVGAAEWKNVKVAMPVVAKHIEIEAKEHNYATPRNYYWYYTNTPLEQVASSVTSSTTIGESSNLKQTGNTKQ